MQNRQCGSTEVLVQECREWKLLHDRGTVSCKPNAPVPMGWLQTRLLGMHSEFQPQIVGILLQYVLSQDAVTGPRTSKGPSSRMLGQMD